MMNHSTADSPRVAHNISHEHHPIDSTEDTADTLLIPNDYEVPQGLLFLHSISWHPTGEHLLISERVPHCFDPLNNRVIILHNFYIID